MAAICLRGAALPTISALRCTWMPLNRFRIVQTTTDTYTRQKSILQAYSHMSRLEVVLRLVAMPPTLIE